MKANDTEGVKRTVAFFGVLSADHFLAVPQWKKNRSSFKIGIEIEIAFASIDSTTNQPYSAALATVVRKNA